MPHSSHWILDTTTVESIPTSAPAPSGAVPSLNTVRVEFMARHVPSQAGNETSEDFETLFMSFTLINSLYPYLRRLRLECAEPRQGLQWCAQAAAHSSADNIHSHAEYTKVNTRNTLRNLVKQKVTLYCKSPPRPGQQLLYCKAV